MAKKLFSFLVLFWALSVFPVVSFGKEISEMDRWIATNFAKGKLPPFSFTYGGRDSDGFIRKWKYEIRKEDSAGDIKYKVFYSDPVTGLRIECEITGYDDFSAVDWVLHIKNCGDKDTPQIEKLNVLDYTCVSKTSGSFVLHHIKGSNARIDDFMPYSDTVTVGTPLSFSPARGRSSDGEAAPYFNLETPDHGGVVFAVGWSGTWFADFDCPSNDRVGVRSGLKCIDLHLHPGESVRTPLISAMFWTGNDRMEGHNKFRRFMRAHNMRTTQGQNAGCPLFAGIAWGDPQPCTVRTCMTSEIAVCNIHRFQHFDCVPDVFWMDAGWYTDNAVKNSQRNWHYTAGTWRPDPERFPDGLRPISDAAHAAGSKLMVWFEPERANNGSFVETEHPEWLLSEPGNDFYHVFDFGNPEARKWMSEYIGDFIEESGIDYYRQDLCIRLDTFWAANDEPGRTGMKEIRHIEGMYAYLDYLIGRFPDILIDNCASGGRRLDIEMYRRSVPLWRSDYVEPLREEGAQGQAYGLNFFLPVHGCAMKSVSDYSFVSCLSPSSLFSVPLVNNPKLNLEDLWQKRDLYKKIQPYLYEDYYPLTGEPDLSCQKIWLAYQMHRPSDGSGIVVAYRRAEAQDNTLTVCLKSLDAGKNYIVTDELCNTRVLRTGAQLAEGLQLKADAAPGSVLLRYEIAE